MSAAIRLSGVTHRHPGAERPALERVDLAVEPGETVALIGPSGAGKSTVLALLDGRLRGWSGEAMCLDRALDPARAPTRPERADVGFIFQEFALVDRASVRQNVLNGRLGRTDPWGSLIGRFSDADRRAAGQAMADAGIAELADRRADRLSGGQRQRVAIARCLAQEPRLILADEPVSNLDPTRAEAILGLITRAARDRGAAVLFTSHQPDLAARHAGRLVGLKDGRIAFDAPAAGVGAGALRALYADEAAAHLRLAI